MAESEKRIAQLEARVALLEKEVARCGRHFQIEQYSF